MPLLIIISVGSIIGVIAVKKFRGGKDRGSVIMDIPEKPKDKLDIPKTPKTIKIPVEKKPVSVLCPICKIRQKILIPITVINEKKPLTTVSIPRDLTCEHHYQIFIDKNFIVRGYQTVDFEYHSEQIEDLELMEENFVDKALVEVKKEIEKEAKSHPEVIETKEEDYEIKFEKEELGTIESKLIEIKEFLSISNEDFDLYQFIDECIEWKKGRELVLDKILSFVSHFSMFKDITPFMNALYQYIRNVFKYHAKNIKELESLLIKNTLLGFIKEYIEYSKSLEKERVLDYLTESLAKLSLPALIVHLGLLLKPMYQDEDYLNRAKKLELPEVKYTEQAENEKAIKESINSWLEKQELTLENQDLIKEKLNEEFEKLLKFYNIPRNSRPYETLLPDLMEMLALRLTVISLMDSISDESLEPVPLN